MTLLDVKIAGALLALAAAGAGLDINGALEIIVLLGAAVAAVGVVWARAVRPAFRFGRKAVEGVEILLRLEAWQKDIRDRVGIIEARLEPLEALDRREAARRLLDEPDPPKP